MALREAPIAQALVRPPSFMGCERRGVLLLGVGSAMLIGPGGIGAGNYDMALFGLAVLPIGFALLSAAGKKDVQSIEIFLRIFFLYRPFRRPQFTARGRWDERDIALRRTP